MGLDPRSTLRRLIDSQSGVQRTYQQTACADAADTSRSRLAVKSTLGLSLAGRSKVLAMEMNKPLHEVPTAAKQCYVPGTAYLAGFEAIYRGYLSVLFGSAHIDLNDSVQIILHFRQLNLSCALTTSRPWSILGSAPQKA